MNEQEQCALARWRPANTRMNRLWAALVGGTCRLVILRLNRLEATGIERFQMAQQRQGRGLLTFSNHVSLFDDPLLPASLGHYTYDAMRWVAADALNFFGSALKARLYSAGKCVPIVRGAGVDQPGFDFLVDRLRGGDWVHLFPEGTRTRDPQSRLQPFKSGIGKLLVEARPLALPFFHTGMSDVLPIGAALPRAGRVVRVHFGDVADCGETFFAALEAGEPTERRQLWDKAAQWAYRELANLQSLMT